MAKKEKNLHTYSRKTAKSAAAVDRSPRVGAAMLFTNET